MTSWQRYPLELVWWGILALAGAPKLVATQQHPSGASTLCNISLQLVSSYCPTHRYILLGT